MFSNKFSWMAKLVLSVAVLSWLGIPEVLARGGGHGGGGHGGGHGGGGHGGGGHGGYSHGGYGHSGYGHGGGYYHHGGGYYNRGYGYSGYGLGYGLGYPGYGYGYPGYGYSYPSYGSYYSPGYYDDSPGYYDPGYDYSYQPPFTSYYPPSTYQDSSAASTTALITLNVPAGAEVWFNDIKTKQTGSQRTFVSPPLQAGYDYQYQIRASWMENGRPVSRTRDVTIHPGDNIQVGFRSTPPSEP